MDSLEKPLGGSEFAPKSTYLNTSACGLLPRRTVEAVTRLAEETADGRPDGAGDFDTVAEARATYARLVGVPAERVALGTSVGVHCGMIAQSMPPGAEILFAEGDFSSVVTPFTIRGDLRTRFVPLDRLAESIRPGTALVAFSSVQSLDGRTADLAAIRAAAAAHGARTLLDATQSAGWLPLRAGEWDYTVAGGYKYLLCPRGASFLTVTEEAQDALLPIHANWVTGEEMWANSYGPVRELARSARRFDEPPVFHAYHGAARSLALLEEIGIERIEAHDKALAARLRAGLLALGHPPVVDESTVVAVPGLGARAGALREAGIVLSDREGNLRVSFHLYNTVADVDHVLDVLEAMEVPGVPAG
ncbi:MULTISPECIES: aminotransferase class V-fold PLP-dependent enzyme [unclassified Streptomyces]|uniref:aminotransferase class V-fold PLP-dependent enzyme n=1 Tax=unclassified Streptomyces TaxID=2593676 RepID=UPI001660D70F|nr:MULTISPECIES: aminotransferase class V-fold PLP-dependent enzyme [unclassified Streptomyces]MBD0709257.1 class V aminotransferase [Streptomyces sp. CBMA291]MBD0713588.1 class V aminotransferase [Streptomyces sp. CBMA370]